MAKTETKEATGKFVNPFEAGKYDEVKKKFIPGPSIDDFIAALDGKSVAEYLKGQIVETNGEVREFDEHDIAWLEVEVKRHGYNEKHKDKFLAQANEDHKKLIIGNKPTL